MKVGEIRGAYAGQVHIDRATGFNGGGFTTKGGDFAQDADGLVGEGLEVFGVYTGGGFGSHRAGMGLGMERRL